MHNEQVRSAQVGEHDAAIRSRGQHGDRPPRQEPSHEFHALGRSSPHRQRDIESRSGKSPDDPRRGERGHMRSLGLVEHDNREQLRRSPTHYLPTLAPADERLIERFPGQVGDHRSRLGTLLPGPNAAPAASRAANS
jgi:hypothetical protein